MPAGPGGRAVALTTLAGPRTRRAVGRGDVTTERRKWPHYTPGGDGRGCFPVGELPTHLSAPGPRSWRDWAKDRVPGSTPAAVQFLSQSPHGITDIQQINDA